MEYKNAAEKKWYTPDELQELPKSDFYREELAQYLGQRITMNVPYYEFKPFKEDKDMGVLDFVLIANTWWFCVNPGSAARIESSEARILKSRCTV